MVENVNRYDPVQLLPIKPELIYSSTLERDARDLRRVVLAGVSPNHPHSTIDPAVGRHPAANSATQLATLL